MTDHPSALVTVPRADLERVRDLLMERIYGSNARSPGHNARLEVEAMLAAAPAAPQAAGVGALDRCHDEHQPGCDCVIPAQTVGPIPSYLERLSAPSREPEGGAVSDAAWAGECLFAENAAAGANIFQRALAEVFRAQPQAREDAQPVGYLIQVAGSHKNHWRHATHLHATEADAGKALDRDPDGDIIPLYTHPAPDALRVAVEALVEARRNLIECGDHFGAGQCADALAALQAEQGAK